MISKAKETEAIELIQSAQKMLDKATEAISSNDDGAVYHIIDNTLGKYVGERPTFITAKNATIDYLETNKDSELYISKWVTTIKK